MGFSIRRSFIARCRLLPVFGILGVLMSCSVLPAAATSDPGAGSTSTTIIPSDSTTTPQASRQSSSDAAIASAASSLLVLVRQLTDSLDQLDTTYLTAEADRIAATTAVASAQQLLATTTASVNDLARQASHMVLKMYVSNSIQENTLSEFLSTQNSATKESVSIYNQIAAGNLDAQIAKLEALKKARQEAVATSRTKALGATQAAQNAAQALSSAHASEGKLLELIASLDSPTKEALSQLESTGDASIQRMLTAGSLNLRVPTLTPPAPAPGAAGAVAYAVSQIGKPYLWGGNGPAAFDCSGLVEQAWAVGGVALPRVAADQFNATIPIGFSDLQPGDLVFFETPVGHVGIYIGNSTMIDAPYTGAFVQIDSIFWENIAGFGRVNAH